MSSLQAGLGVAVEYALSLGLDWIWQRNQVLAASLRQQLAKLPGVTVIDHGRQLCSIVGFYKVRQPVIDCRASITAAGSRS